MSSIVVLVCKVFGFDLLVLGIAGLKCQWLSKQAKYIIFYRSLNSPCVLGREKNKETCHLQL